MSLASFVPRLALSIASEGPIPEAGRARPCAAAALFVDISGFTRWVDVVTEQLGEHGAEQLQDTLNACFAPIVEAVDRAGGQVLAFPGDAALALWPVSLEGATGPNLSEATRRAAQCALELRDHVTHQRRIGEIELRFRAVVTAGAVQAVMAGGVDGQWNLVVGGPAIRQLAATWAAVGDVAMSFEAARLCGRFFSGAPHASGWRVDSIAADTTHTVDQPDPILTPADSEISPLVPVSVRARLESGHDAWLSEFRIITVMFVVFGDPAVSDAPHHAVRTLQTITRHFDGELNQLVADEKGLTAVIVFGLFQRTHEDDAIRAIGAARAIADELTGRDRPRVGIATGRVFTGVRGGVTRREFAVIGPAVILAARLASVADSILCDAVTYEKSKRAFGFDEIGPLALKGKGLVSGVWRPREPIAADAASLRDHVEIGHIARSHELAMAERRLRALSETGNGSLIVVTGDAGIGKSALTRAVREMARTLGLRCAAGGGESIHAATTLHAWRPIIAALLADELSDTPPNGAAVVDRLAMLLGADETDWFPLLNPVLPVHVPENERTAHLTPESRARATRQLLGSLMRRLTSRRDLLVVIEDTQWIDSASWELIEDLVAKIPHVVVLLTARMTPETPGRVATLRRARDLVEIPLLPMSSAQVAEIVARRVGANGLSSDLSEWIVARCEGNPLFGQELAVMLLERGAAVIEDGACRIAQDASAEDLASLPTTIHSVVAARIDRLAASDQLTVKVAAVFGRHFGLDMLAAISPVQESMAALAARLARIATTGLVCELSDRAKTFTFSHALVQEVAYGLLPFAQRRLLHRSAAECLESALNTADPTVFPLLAHHWECAAVPSKAILYLEQAGEHALLNASSNPEAEAFLRRLIELGQRQPRPGTGAGSALPLERSARWERMLSQAISRQGRHAEAVLHIERGLTLLRRSVPRGDWRSKLEAARGVAARLALPPPRLGLSRRENLTGLEAMRLYDSLVQLLYVGETARQRASSPLVAIVALLRAARLGEEIGLCGELSRAYSMMANLIAMFGRQRLALLYADRARELSEYVNDKQALFRALTIGQLPAFIFGQWNAAEARLIEGIALGAALRNVHEALIAECTLAHIDLHRDRLDEALRRFDHIGRHARDAAFILPELWAMAGMAHVRLRQDRAADAIDAAEACVKLADRHASLDLNSRFEAYGVLASAWTRQGERQRALAAVEQAMQAAAAGAQLSFSSSAGFVGVTEALLDACESGVGDVRRCQARVRKWLRRFAGAAFCRPILRPARLHFGAVWHERTGHDRLARRKFNAAIRAAERLAMPYDARRSRRALARVAHRPGDRQVDVRTGT